jgi:hypothetical protein
MRAINWQDRCNSGLRGVAGIAVSFSAWKIIRSVVSRRRLALVKIQCLDKQEVFMSPLTDIGQSNAFVGSTPDQERPLCIAALFCKSLY